MMAYRKDENRFKFIPFSERIANINVDVFHRVSHRNEESDENRKTYLLEAADKWIVLNRTKEWLEFHKAVVAGGIVTLPQILNQKDVLADLFLEHLPKQTEHSVQPVLELLVAFVKDIRHEFYPFYPRILRELIKLLKCHDPDVIEQAFVCLAYLFKYLHRNLVKDLDTVLVDLAPLLDESQPEYVRNFAAESFAFVARKVKNKETFLTLVLATVQKAPELVSGCGKLLMETMYGIKGQLHSSAGEMLQTIFRGFSSNDLPRNLLLALVQHMVRAYLARIEPQHSIIFSVIVDILKSNLTNDKALKPILTVMLEILKFKGGIHLRDAKEVAALVIELSLTSQLTTASRLLVSHLVVQLLLAYNVKVPQEYSARLASMMLKQPEEVLLNFVENVCEYTGFEAVILPQLLETCSTTADQMIGTLAKIIVKKTRKRTEWMQYPLKFKTNSMQETLIANISESDGNVSEVLCDSLLVLPHITPSDTEKISVVLSNLVTQLLTRLKDQNQQNSVLCCLFTTLESMMPYRFRDLDTQQIYQEILPLANESFIAFKILEILTGIDKTLDTALLLEIAINRLTSPYHKIRTSALKCLKNIYGNNAVLDTCLKAEMTPLTIQTYRNATLLIRELYYEKINQDIDIKIPLRYLFGYLFTNFSLVESDVIHAIQSYDKCEESTVWTIIKERLTREMDNYRTTCLSSHISEYILAEAGCDDRVNQTLFKDRLWKILNNFTLSEKQEKDVIDMAINYSQCHALRQYWDYTFDIRPRDSNPAEKHTSDPESTFKINKKMLGYQLDIILKTRAHCSIKYRAAEMKKLSMELLLDGEPNLRKSALGCLIAQNSKNLSPYRKHLMDLINEDGFKTAIVHFQLDKEEGEVKEGHRDLVMPVVLRLLYSKMVSSAPTQRGNKSSAAALRRKQVMRFLSACQEAEIKEFLTMAFSVLKLEGEISCTELTTKALNQSLDKIIHPKKLQSCINLANVVLEYLGGYLTTELQKFLLRVILSITATVSGVLSNRENILSGFVPILKKLRGVCMTTLITYFDKFSKYPWSEDEINAVFSVAIWPLADKLSLEGIHSPTPLLKLFSVWSEYPRYFVLFSRYVENDETKTILAYIIDLLLNEQCQQNVVTAIMSILERLLTLRDEMPMETDDEPLVPDLQVSNIRPVNSEILENLNLKEELNYGSQILIPHVGAILEVLRRQLTRNEKRNFNKSEMIVLARITELATSPEHGHALIGLLLRILSGKSPSDDEVLINTILTVKNLLGIVSKPLTYLRNLAVIFGNVELVQARKELVECIADLSKRCPELSELAAIVRDLNAFDRRWIDQCDFNKRLDALKLVRVMAADGKLSMEIAMFVIHTGFFFLKNEKDLSIRDSTELCLKEICPKLLEMVQDNLGAREFLTETLLKGIHAGILGKDDRFKSSVISLLGHLARECPTSHHVLKDLSLFSNKLDMEVDFFENIHHLQLYRRNRALLKLTSIVKTLKKPLGIRTITQFLMPLSNQFLCCETYSGKNSLVDAAIESVGILCRLLPWYPYQTVLKYYLFKLRTVIEYQRQCVRLVIAILDAFHFDLSQADTISKDDVKLTEEKEDTKDVDELIISDDPIEDAMTVDQDKFLVDVIIQLNPSAALKVQKTISTHLLAQLYKAIGERSTVEAAHRVNKKSLGPDKDEEDILRVPIAVTLVKLLQKLPGDILDSQLPGILTKLCTFLKSHLESVRRVTRETLQQIMVAVGPDRLPLLLSEMTALLTKGFHVHVLAFTINAVIQSLQGFFKPGDLDKNIATILQVCSADLFGAAAEEKEVARIQKKHKEVRSHKSYNLLHLVSQFVTDKCLTDLILPMKQALSTKNSHKTTTKCQEYARQIILGLAMNKFISAENLIIFLYGAASESIPELLPTPSQLPKKYNPKEKQDCFLLAPEPKSRALSSSVKQSSRSGAHVIIEFGLGLLMVLLKQDRVKKMNLEAYLDPFVSILRSAIDSQHIKVTTLAIKCLTRLADFELPSLKDNIKPIVSSMFRLLHKFAVAGLSKGDNFDLVLALFKMMCVVVRDVDFYTLADDQLHALLLYAEQDIHDNSRQAVAFGLLKSILHRKLNTDELHPVMQKVATLSITSDMQHVRVQARQTVRQYIMDYPLGKKLEELIGFYLAQMDYELESGRQSALEMVLDLINSFPPKVLKEQSGLFFLTLGTRLVNDDSPSLKKIISAVIRGMLLRLDDADKDELYDMILIWLRQKKLLHRRLAVQLAGIFVAVEKCDFQRRIGKTLPLIVKQLTGDRKPGQFVKIQVTKNEEESLLDHHLYLVFVLLVKLSVNCPSMLEGDGYRDQISVIADAAQCFLCHEHEWVRVGAVQYLGSLFSAVDPEIMAVAVNGGDADVRFWDAADFSVRLKSLILDHTAQFVPGVEITADFSEQLMKNLVYFAKVLKNVGENKDVNFFWLVRRMRRIVNLEIARTPATHSLRSAVFMWIGAVAVCFTKEELLPVLYNLAAPLIREIEISESESKKSDLAVLANEVANKIKKKVGVDVFAECVVKLQARTMKKRVERKAIHAQEFVLDPESAVKRKMAKQVRKKENKKRLKEFLHGKKSSQFKAKKRKLDV